MKTQKTILCATLVLLFVLVASASAYWNVIDLGTLGGGEGSYAYSINDNGQIVGSVIAGQSHSCLFDSTGGGANIDLGSLGFTESVVCYSINNIGQIVGTAHLAYGFTGRACLFDSTGLGANKNLGSSGYEQSCANAINNKGKIVGNAQNYGHDYVSYGHAFIFDPTGGGANIDLGALNSYAHYSTAQSINDNGKIVGGAWHDLYVNPDRALWYYDVRACLFDQTGGGANIDLGTLGGYNYSIANFINDSGQIVGMAYSTPNPSNPIPYHACVFDPTGGGDNIDLGTVIGFNATSATSINDHGQIVGDAWKMPYPPTYHACLFDPTGQGNNVDLNTLIDPSSDWTLTHASDINNNGWIVGYGWNPYGQNHGYLLIPEPASAIMMGLAGLFLALRRRRR